VPFFFLSFLLSFWTRFPGIDHVEKLHYGVLSMGMLRNYKFTILCGILILVALLVPSSTYQGMPSFPGIDKLVHSILFFLFALAYMLEYTKFHRRHPRFTAFALTVLCFIVGTETLQLLTATRHFELADMLFDVLGASVAFVITCFAKTGE
jgi:VanZ family protein